MEAFLNTIKDILGMFRWTDALDIAIVAFLMYQFIIFLKNNRTQLLVKGSIIIAAVYIVSLLLSLNTLSFIVETVIRNGVIALLIIFQPELRSVIEKVGRSRFSMSNLFKLDSDEKKIEKLAAISSVVEAYRLLQKEKMGALVVFEREVRLDDIVSTGTGIDATPSAAILGNIFFNKAPLHDGAVIIRDSRICAAGCILPLTQNSELGIEIGTRHRAALGMSDNTDAVVVVLSEENGLLSIAENGVFQRYTNVAEFTSALMKVLMPEDKHDEEEDKIERKSFWGTLFGKKNGRK